MTNKPFSELKGMVMQMGGMNYVLAREAREEYAAK